MFTRNVAQYPLHHVTYAPLKFEVAMSNGLGGDASLRNTFFKPFALTLYPLHHEAHAQLLRPAVYEKNVIDGGTMDHFGTKLIHYIF